MGLGFSQFDGPVSGSASLRYGASLALLALSAAALGALAFHLLAESGRTAREDRFAAACGAGFAALVFALHPLRVETVAWASCQVYLVAGFFYILAAYAYLRARRGPAGRRSAWAAACLICFVLSLAAKPIGLSLPLVLLVIDYYPLGRWRQPSVDTVIALIEEKFPLFAAAAVFAFIAAAGTSGSSAPLADTPAGQRVAQAAFGLAFYPLKLVAPFRLAPFYLPTGPVALASPPYVWALAASAAFSILAVVMRRRHPWLLAVWLAHVAALLPFLGLWPFDAARKLAADRWFLTASMGWSILGGGALCAALRRSSRPTWRGFCAAAACAALAGLATLSRRQALLWRDPEALQRQTMAVSPTCALCEHEMASYLARQGRTQDAAAHESQAIRIEPDYWDAISAARDDFESLGRVDDTIALWRKMVLLRPDDAMAHFNLGLYCAKHGRMALAISETRRAAALSPDLAQAHNNLGWLLRQAGREEDALGELQAALDLDPSNVLARGNLAAAVNALPAARRSALAQERVNRGVAAMSASKVDEAAQDFRVAAALQPENPMAAYDLGVAYIQKNQRAEAINAFRRAIALDAHFTNAYLNLGVILTAQGDLAEADKACAKAAELNPGAASNSHCYRRAR